MPDPLGFIVLEACSGELTIRYDRIESFIAQEGKPAGSVVRMMSGEDYYVKQSPDAITAMLIRCADELNDA